MLSVVIIAQSSPSSGSGLGLLLPLVLLAALYLLMIRPQRARMKQMTAVQRSLEPGRRVVTTAGLHATVTEVDGDTVLLEIAPGVVARFSVQAVVRTLPEDEPRDEPDAVSDPEASSLLPPGAAEPEPDREDGRPGPDRR